MSDIGSEAGKIVLRWFLVALVIATFIGVVLGLLGAIWLFG
jgi:hypothetical protein